MLNTVRKIKKLSMKYKKTKKLLSVMLSIKMGCAQERIINKNA